MQIGNWGEHFIGIHGMPAHFFPFDLVKATGTLQDLIWNCHLAHIMEERTTTQVNQILFRKINFACDFKRQFCNALSMTFSLAISQIERPNPTLNCPLISFLQVVMSSL